ncbi:MAG: extracellular solute-binding protein [Firmicutes bacterium]|nr:extracellular solute-binding protein [Bacillota bacterium]MCL1953271.1 extracellular solute-binding protein [Bacillota bacterium]
MKKIIINISLACIVLFVGLTTLIGCTNGRSQVLRIYNWEDYLSPDVIPQFEEWYNDKFPQEPIRVETSGFSTNEQMYTQIASKKADYDLIVPSDYMVARMKTEGLLMPLDLDIVYEGWDSPFDIEEGIYNSDIVDIIKSSFDPQMNYSVPYLWGTVGILYDPVRGPDTLNDVHSWNAIFGNEYSGKIYMQDSVTDAFAIGSIWANSHELQEQNIELNSPEHVKWVKNTINNTSQQNIDKVRQTLIDQRPNLLAYAVDDANERLATASDTAGWLALVWSVQAGYAMFDNTDLRYVVPDEGSNTWIDTFAIPTTARNPKAANYFLQFLLKDDIAYSNMEYIGATTPIESVYDDYSIELEDEMQGLEDEMQGLEDEVQYLIEQKEYYDQHQDWLDEEWDYDELLTEIDVLSVEIDELLEEIDFLQNYIYILFPPNDVINRVAAYQDWGDAKENINMMWIQVKSGGNIDDYFGGGAWIMLGLLIASLAVVTTHRFWWHRLTGIFKN